MDDVEVRPGDGPPERETKAEDPRRPIVLVIEDHEPTLALLLEQLSGAGYEMLGAPTGERGVELASSRRPDVVLLDLGLPGTVQGEDVLGAFAENPALAGVPVIVVTGSGDPDTLAQTLQRGAHDFVGKPYDAVELRARIAVAIRIKQMHDGLRFANARLAREALTDALTGLANRRHGLTELQRMVAHAVRHGEAFGVIQLDVDGFKSINDRHGHAVGDALLRSIAGSLLGALRGEDVLIRWGGDEFVALLPCADGPSALIVAERLRLAVAKRPLRIGALNLQSTVSIGWACGPDGSQPEQLLARADAALYDAKRAGRDTVAPAAAPT